MARVSPEKQDPGKREAILDAALELFADLGYHGTTVPEVADQAGVGAGTMYRYFANKEALVNALFQRWKKELGRTIMEDFPVDAPVRTQFHEIWKRAASFAVRYPRALDFLELHHHGTYLDADSIAVEKQLLLPIYAFAEHAKQQQQIKEGIRAELFGALVWGAFMGVINAARKNFVALDKKTFDQAEECMWQAIRR